jgi:hypothetical protein
VWHQGACFERQHKSFLQNTGLPRLVEAVSNIRVEPLLVKYGAFHYNLDYIVQVRVLSPEKVAKYQYTYIVYIIFF